MHDSSNNASSFFPFALTGTMTANRERLTCVSFLAAVLSHTAQPSQPLSLEESIYMFNIF